MDFEGAHDIQSVRIYPRYPSSGRLSGSTITLVNNEERLAYTLQLENADDIEVFDIDVSNFVSLGGGLDHPLLGPSLLYFAASNNIVTHIGRILCFFMTR